MAGIVQYIFVIYLSCNCLGKDFLLCVLNDTIYGDMVTKAIGLRWIARFVESGIHLELLVGLNFM